MGLARMGHPSSTVMPIGLLDHQKAEDVHEIIMFFHDWIEIV